MVSKAEESFEAGAGKQRRFRVSYLSGLGFRVWGQKLSPK